MKLLAEFLARAEDSALDGADGEIKLLGDLAVFVSGDEKIEWHAVFIGERVEGDRNLLDSVRAFGCVKTGVLTYVKVIEVLGLVDDCSLANILSVIVDENVAHDREDPALEVDVVNILVLIVESLEGSILKQILSLLAVGGELIGEVE